jgi:hypothetical protein
MPPSFWFMFIWATAVTTNVQNAADLVAFSILGGSHVQYAQSSSIRTLI